MKGRHEKLVPEFVYTDLWTVTTIRSAAFSNAAYLPGVL